MLLRHGIADHVLNRIQTMKELGESYSEILSYYQKYDYIPKVLIEFAEEFRNSSDTEKAVDILVSGKKGFSKIETDFSFSFNQDAEIKCYKMYLALDDE